MMNRPMELDIWKGDWGLPSVDIECLQIFVSKVIFEKIKPRARITSSKQNTDMLFKLL